MVHMVWAVRSDTDLPPTVCTIRFFQMCLCLEAKQLPYATCTTVQHISEIQQTLNQYML
jgi:hypothetical protein